MVRAKANWRRLKLMKEKIDFLLDALARVKRWESTPASLSVMIAIPVAIFCPRAVACLGLICAALWTLSSQPEGAGRPLPMEADTIIVEEEDNAEVTVFLVSLVLSYDDYSYFLGMTA